MSYYDEDNYDDHRRHKGDRDRRQRSEPKYEEEEIIRARSGPKGSSKDLVPSPRQRRRDSSESSIEEIPRDFPPRGGGYDRRSDYSSRRARSAKDSRRGGRNDDYDDGYYDERPKKRGSKRDRRRDYSSSSSSRSRSRGPPRERRKSLGEQALGALGIGGAGAAALGALAGQRSKSHDRDDRSSRRDRRSRRYSSSSSSRSRGRGSKDMDMNAKMLQAAKAAVTAGGIEAWRMRKEPGGWGGPKGKRVLTAAIGAAGVDGLLGKEKNGGGTGNVIQSTIGGLVGNRLLNGSRKDERSRSRSRGRDDSRDRGGKGIAGLGAGALAAAATKAFENRSKSRGRGKRDYSSSSDDDYGRRRGGGRRSKSVSDYMRQGMAGLGIGSNKDKRDTTDRGTPRDLGNESDSGSEHPHSQLRAGPNGAATGALAHVKHNQDNSNSSSSDDDISSSEEERERKKLGKKQLITAGLASVATIHAAHNVYQSVHMRKVRAKEVAEGDMSPAEARKKKNNARLHNAASIGIAALGVKGAYSEWKEMQESRHEVREFDEQRERRHERKLERAMRRQEGHEMETGSSSMSGYSTPQQYHGPAAASNASSYNEYMSSHYPVTAPNMTSNDPNRYYNEQQTGPGPHYSDGNPFQGARAQPVPHHHAPVPHMGPPPGYR